MGSWTGPHPFSRKVGLLGPRPLSSPSSQQAHLAYGPDSSSIPTNIFDVVHTLSLSSPSDQWYMDIGVTSHMIANGGTFSSYFNLSNTH